MENQKTQTNKKKFKDKKNITPQKNVTMADVRMQWNDFIKRGINPTVLESLGYAYTNNPFIQNQRTKGISTKPVDKTRDNLEKALIDIDNNEQSLRQTSQSLFSNYSLLKLNSMYPNILTYRNYFYPKYISNQEVKSKIYKEERKKISKWIDLLQPKRIFQEIVEKAQWEGKVVYYLRDSVAEGKNDFDYVYLQQIPSDYLKIVGWNTASKFTIMFDFTYFWQAGTTPEQFPPIFKKYYEELNGIVPPAIRNKRPNPNAMPNNLSTDTEFYYRDNKWFYWRTLPIDECFTFSQSESNPYQLPNTIGLFLQAKDLQDYSYLQQQLLELPLSGVIMATLPMAKDSNGTISTDNYGIGTDAFSFFTEMFNQAAPRGIQLFLSPATNQQFFKFDNDVVNNSSIVTNAIQQFNSVAGVSGLNSTTDKPNMAQVKTQQEIESGYAERFYKQFENCINIWWKNKLDLKFEWRFKIKGNRFNDSTTLGMVKDLVSLGQNYLMPELLSYFDLSIDDAQSLQSDVIESKIYEKFQLVQSAYNQTMQNNGQASVSLNKGGRPSANEDTIESDGTATSISTGTNTAEGRQMSANKINYCVECGEVLSDNSNYPFCSKECKEENQNRLGVE